MRVYKNGQLIISPVPYPLNPLPIVSEAFYHFKLRIYFAVVSQAFTVNLMEESVLRGNAAILKCHISTFVTEYVSVSSWIVSEGDTEELEIKADSNDIGIFVIAQIAHAPLLPSCSFHTQSFKKAYVFSGFTSVYSKFDGGECFAWEFGNHQMPYTQLRHGIRYGLILDNIRRRRR